MAIYPVGDFNFTSRMVAHKLEAWNIKGVASMIEDYVAATETLSAACCFLEAWNFGQQVRVDQTSIGTCVCRLAYMSRPSAPSNPTYVLASLRS